MVRRGSGRRKGSQRCSSIAGKQTPTREASQTGGVKGNSTSERDGEEGRVGWMVENITGLSHTGQGKAKLGE